MTVKIAKYPGDYIYFYPTIKNNGPAETVFIEAHLATHETGAYLIVRESFDLPANSVQEYALGGIIPSFAPAEIHDTLIVLRTPDYDHITSRTFGQEVQILAEAKVTVTITNRNAPLTWKYSHDLFAGWNFVTYQGETTTVRNAVESIQAPLLNIGYYIGTVYYEYSMDDTVEQGRAVAVNVSQACRWGMPPKVEPPYWVGLTDRSIPNCPFTPINQDFNWAIYANELAAFMCYDATYNLIDTPNSGQFRNWGIFIEGEIYTWNWATGQLEGVFG